MARRRRTLSEGLGGACARGEQREVGGGERRGQRDTGKIVGDEEMEEGLQSTSARKT